jgi:hypothetical protein
MFRISICPLILCVLYSMDIASAATAHFRSSLGETDFTFKLEPALFLTDRFQFFDPTGFGSNACDAEKRFGQPIPPAADLLNSHLIVGRLGNIDPNLTCTGLLDPVRGIEGTFGPLSDGNYIFRDYAGNDHPFTVGAVPEPGALAMIGTILLLGMKRRRAY